MIKKRKNPFLDQSHRSNIVDLEKTKELAKKHNMDLNLMKKLLASPYEFIHKTTKDINFKDGLTKEEFENIKKDFNIPALGKIFASNYLYNEIQKKKK
jgi:hypothetical protein